MKLDEYSSRDGLALAELVRNGDVSPLELRECAGRAIRALNPQLNAVIEVFEDRLAGGDPDADPNGTFGGVPYLLKDIGAAEKGRLCEMGSRLMHGYRADKDSFATTLFKKAGLVNLGRTTTPEAGFAGTTESVATGITRNPWNPALSTGGSSGGAAACVAAGIVPLAHGSDGAGSIRIPGSLCGLVGLKPSRGRISFAPDFDEPQLGCASEFVLTRSVRDAAAMLDALAVPAPGDPFVLPRPLRSWLEASLAPQEPLRIACSTVNWCTGKPVPELLARAATATARDLEALGHHVEEASPQFDAEIAYSANRLAFNSTLLLLQPFAAMLGKSVNVDTMEPVLLDAHAKMMAMTAAEFFFETLKFNIARRQLGTWFESFDVLVTPTIAVPRVEFGTFDCSSFSSVDAFREASEAAIFTFTSPFNVTGQPAISLPLASTDEGTPVGVQLVGLPGREDVLLRLATALEQVRPWSGRTPQVHASRAA